MMILSRVILKVLFRQPRQHPVGLEESQRKNEWVRAGFEGQ
jgi:hypothetical protein